MAKESNENDKLHAGNRKKRWMEQSRPTWKEWLLTNIGFIWILLPVLLFLFAVYSGIYAAGLNLSPVHVAITTSNNPTTVPTGTTPTNAPTNDLLSTDPTSSPTFNYDPVFVEPEPCQTDEVDVTNGGCITSIGAAFTPISVGMTIRGTFSTFVTSDGSKGRDIDQYRLHHSGGFLSASVSSNYPLRLGLLAGFDDWRCPSDGKLKFIEVSQGDSDLSVAHILDPGYYAVVVSPFDDTGLECNRRIAITLGHLNNLKLSI